MSRKTATQEPPADAVEFLVQDHHAILSLFTQFEKLVSGNEQDPDAKQLLVERACTALSIHAQVEEELFYPALRGLPGMRLLLDAAEVEHACCTQLVSDLECMHPEDDFYDAKFLVLGEYVRHHITEEQEKIFPRARKSSVNLDDLGEEIRRRKNELHIAFAVPVEEEQVTITGIRLRERPPEGSDAW